MSLVASLDMGSDKMVLAIGEKTGDECRLMGIMSVMSQGMKHGQIKDKLAVKACVQHLLERIESEYSVHLDSIKIALSGDSIKRIDNRETVKFSRTKNIDEHDVVDLEKRCSEVLNSQEEMIIDTLPYIYEVDKKVVKNPVGISANRLDVHYHIYIAKSYEVQEFKSLFTGLGFENVAFYSQARAYKEALVSPNAELTSFALVDLGAESINIVIINDTTVEFDAELPLGCNTVDYDLNKAFSIHDLEIARRLKHEYGIAIRAGKRNDKIRIPDTNFSIESKDLALVEQCRLEELLEAVILQIQESGFYDELENGIILTGGGSRVAAIDTLLERMTGHKVAFANAYNVSATRAASLRTPEYLTALGLLQCERVESKKTGGKMKRWFGKFF